MNIKWRQVVNVFIAAEYAVLASMVVPKVLDALPKDSDTFQSQATSQPVVIEGGTPEQQAELLQAHERAVHLNATALERLQQVDASSPDYAVHFGDIKHIESVRHTYSQVQDNLEGGPTRYQIGGFGCHNADAYTQKWKSKVWICPGFFGRAPQGPEGQDSTLVHEHSHQVWRHDHAYREDIFALTSEKAVENAETYGYFAACNELAPAASRKSQASTIRCRGVDSKEAPRPQMDPLSVY